MRVDAVVKSVHVLDVLSIRLDVDTVFVSIRLGVESIRLGVDVVCVSIRLGCVVVFLSIRLGVSVDDGFCCVLLILAPGPEG